MSILDGIAAERAMSNNDATVVIKSTEYQQMRCEINGLKKQIERLTIKNETYREILADFRKDVSK